MFRFIGVCHLARPSEPLTLDLLDKLFWVAVRRFWSGWQQSLIVVTPETVVRWHRAGFPFVLEADLQGQEARRETIVEGGSGIDLPDGR
jgi:hypothetical protein